MDRRNAFCVAKICTQIGPSEGLKKTCNSLLISQTHLTGFQNAQLITEAGTLPESIDCGEQLGWYLSAPLQTCGRELGTVHVAEKVTHPS